MIHIKNKKRLKIILILGFVLFIFVIFEIYPLMIDVITGDPSPWRVTNSSSEFIFEKSLDTNIHLRRSEYEAKEEVFIMLIDEEIIFYDKVLSLIRMNLLTNVTRWQQGLTKPINAITDNGKLIFAAQNNQKSAVYDAEKLIEPGSIKVTAYNVHSGAIEWSSSYQGIQFVSRIHVNEDVLVISGDNGHGAYPDGITLDLNSGKKVIADFQTFDDYESFIDISSEKRVYPDRIMKLNDDSLIFYAEDRISALIQSKIRWSKEAPNLASNIGYANEVVFFLTVEGTLQALDFQTGDLLGYVSFEPENSSNYVQLSNYGVPRNFIAASNDIVIVHFSDTQQIFVFRFLISTP